MIEEIKKIASAWLKTKKVDLLFGLKKETPYIFTTPDELNELTINTNSPLLNVYRPVKRNIIYLFQEKYPDLKIGVIARACDERAIIELAKLNQINLDKLEILGIPCSKEMAIECRCPKPFPKTLNVGEKVEPEIQDLAINTLLAKNLTERLNFWKYELSKCIKCYGCRNACSLCTCQDCKMEQDEFVKTGRLPPEFPIFHFIRFYHLADKCVECGRCERACPVGIPLLTISKLLRVYVKELFNYESGVDVNQKSPIVLNLDEAPIQQEKE
ncbi:MAG: 4Fe-4S binding protein [Candidatus Stahlbacteria bacterium]|nr:4Fe-4S binding protein [Candidatus Stahlbacteria bacterium]